MDNNKKSFNFKEFMTTIGLIMTLVSFIKMIIGSFSIFKELSIMFGISVGLLLLWILMLYIENKRNTDGGPTRSSIFCTITGMLGFAAIIISIIYIIFNFFKTDLIFAIIGTIGILIASIASA